MDYESLLKEAEDLNIVIKEKKLQLREGLCCNNRIAINSDIKNLREKNCVLAEELGHYHTSSGNILNLTDIRNTKQEKRARNWAYEKLVGIIPIIKAFEKNIRSKHELAEYLNVTEQFIDEAINHYREKYGVYTEIDNYIVYFEPNLMVLKMF